MKSIVLQKKRTAKPLRATRRPRGATRAKILVVDDEPTVRQLISQILAEEGHVVEATDDGRDALNRIKHNGYDLILVDDFSNEQKNRNFFSIGSW